MRSDKFENSIFHSSDAKQCSAHNLGFLCEADIRYVVA